MQAFFQALFHFRFFTVTRYNFFHKYVFTYGKLDHIYKNYVKYCLGQFSLKFIYLHPVVSSDLEPTRYIYADIINSDAK